MSGAEAENQNDRDRSGVESNNGFIRTHEDKKELEREIGKIFGRDIKKGGRPSVGETEFRKFYFQYANFSLFEKFAKIQNTDTDKNKKSGGQTTGFFGQFFGSDFLGQLEGESREKILEKLSSLLPIGGAIIGLWLIEEEQMKRRANNEKMPVEIPEVIHTLVNFTKLLNTLLTNLNLLLMSIGEFLGHPLDTIAKNVARGAASAIHDSADKSKRFERIQQGDLFGFVFSEFLRQQLQGKIPGF